MAATSNFWSIPPIQDTIASHLDESDFYECIFVSKLLHQVFIPFLWRKVTVRDESELLTFTSSEAQARNRQYIKTFALDQWASQEWIDDLKEQGPFINLTSLTLLYDYMSSAVCTMELLEAIAWHSKLEHLEIELKVCELGFQNVFLRFMAQMTHLRRLNVVLQRYQTILDLIVVFGACKNLEELVYSSLDCPDLGADIFGGVEFPMTRIKRLTFYPRGLFGQALLEHFLPSCPQLQRLELVGNVAVPGAARRIASAIMAHCVHLDEVCLDNASGLDVREILVACPRLRRLTARMPDQDQDAFLSMIIEHHGSTLEDFDMNEHAVTMEQVFQIAGSCRKLQSLRIPVKWPCGLLQGGTPTKDLSKITWACTGLKVLSLHFSFVHEETDESSDSEDDGANSDRSSAGSTVSQQREYDRQSVEAFYRQVSRLTGLQTLDLGPQYGAVGFKEAFLQHVGCLSNLKDLRQLYFADAEDSPLSDEEKGMLLDQWPRLMSLSGLVDPELDDTDENSLPLIVARRAQHDSK